MADQRRVKVELSEAELHVLIQASLPLSNVAFSAHGKLCSAHTRLLLSEGERKRCPECAGTSRAARPRAPQGSCPTCDGEGTVPLSREQN